MNGNLAYKEELREEIIGGKVVMMASPSMNHNRVSGNIHTIFDVYLEGRQCEPCQDGTALYLEENAEEYRPDMMVVCDPEKVKRKGVYGAPDLVVEVLSPSTARYDRGRKKDVYEAHGVREYWIVEPATKTVEQYVLESGRFILRGVYMLYPDYLLEDMKEEEREAVETEFKTSLFDDLVIRLDKVFARVIPGL